MLGFVDWETARAIRAVRRVNEVIVRGMLANGVPIENTLLRRVCLGEADLRRGRPTAGRLPDSQV